MGEGIVSRLFSPDGVGAGLALGAFAASLAIAWGAFEASTLVLLAIPTGLACLPLFMLARVRQVFRVAAIVALVSLVVSTVGFLFLPSAGVILLGALGRR